MGRGDTERILVSVACFLAAINRVTIRLTNDQARYIRDPSVELVNTLLKEAM